MGRARKADQLIGNDARVGIRRRTLSVIGLRLFSGTVHDKRGTAPNIGQFWRRHDGNIAYVTMNRPERRNALSLEHMQELIDVLHDDRRASADVAVVILRGNGPAFSAGHDLREMIGPDARLLPALFDVCTELMETYPVHPAAGDRPGPWHRDGRRLPAGRHLRSGAWRPRTRASPRPASRSGCSARRRWSR